MLFRIVVLFLIGFVWFAACRPECRRCPEKWTRYDGFCYRYFSAKKTWEEAHSFCDTVYTAGYITGPAYKKATCDLPSIHSEGEQNFLYDFWKSVRGEKEKAIWIGLNDLRRDRDFDWADGTPIDYTNWAPSEPNNKLKGEHYGQLLKDGKWNDNKKRNFAFVCKIKLI